MQYYPVRLVREGYHGYNILQIGHDEFLAFPQSACEYQPGKTGSFHGASPEAVMAEAFAESVTVRIEAWTARLALLMSVPDRLIRTVRRRYDAGRDTKR